MRTQYLWLCLMLLGWLVGCTPTETAPLSATRPIALATPVLASTGTPTATATATPFPTPLSLWEIAGTQTAVAPPPVTLTPMNVPQPTSIPFSDLVWQIVFVGRPCPAHMICDDMLPGDREYYLINSDGSGMVSLQEITELPAQLQPIQFMRFSSNGGQRIAYAAWPYLFLANADGSNPVPLRTLPDGYDGFDFLLGTDCLVTYVEVPSDNEVILEKSCLGTSDIEVIDIIPLPEVRLLERFHYRLSPQRDKVLAYGRDQDNSTSLYVKEIGNDKPPLLIFHESPRCNGYVYSADVRWHSNGETIEFVTISICSGDTAFTSHAIQTFYVTDWQGQRIDIRLQIEGNIPEMLPEAMWFGDWSPDGQEFVFTYRGGEIMGDKNGLYILDFEQGTWRQILSEVYVTQIRTWELELSDKK